MSTSDDKNITKEGQPADKAQPKASDVQRIDAIKELIFGENMQEYDAEFKDVKDLIAKTKQDLIDQLEQAREGLIDDIEKLRTNMNEQLDELRKDTDNRIYDLQDAKTDRRELAKMLHDVADKLEA